MCGGGLLKLGSSPGGANQKTGLRRKILFFLSGELGLINGAGQILMYRYIGPSLLCVTEMSSCPQAGRDIGCIRRRRVPCEDELSWFVHR